MSSTITVRGRKFRSVSECVRWVTAGNSVFFAHKFMHHGFVMQLKLHTVSEMVRSGQMRRASCFRVPGSPEQK